MKGSAQPLNYRPCSAADVNLLVEISRNTFIAAFEKDNNSEDFKNYLDSAFSKRQLQRELENEDSLFYFVYHENDLAGYFKLNLNEAQTDIKDQYSMELERIYVTNAYQGKGIGAWVLREIIKIAKELKLSYLWLGVWEHNPGAIRFYQRYGFQKFGTHPYYIGTDKQTDWLLRLDLK